MKEYYLNNTVNGELSNYGKWLTLKRGKWVKWSSGYWIYGQVEN